VLCLQQSPSFVGILCQREPKSPNFACLFGEREQKSHILVGLFLQTDFFVQKHIQYGSWRTSTVIHICYICKRSTKSFIFVGNFAKKRPNTKMHVPWQPFAFVCDFCKRDGQPFFCGALLQKRLNTGIHEPRQWYTSVCYHCIRANELYFVGLFWKRDAFRYLTYLDSCLHHFLWLRKGHKVPCGTFSCGTFSSKKNPQELDWCISTVICISLLWLQKWQWALFCGALLQKRPFKAIHVPRQSFASVCYVQ